MFRKALNLKLFFLIIFISLFSLIKTSSNLYAVIYATPDSNNIFYIVPGGTGNCSSWDNACDIDKLGNSNNDSGCIRWYIANHSSENFKIFIKKGNYTAHYSFYLPFDDRISIYGGLEGNETSPITTNLPEKSIITDVATDDYYGFWLGSDADHGGYIYNVKIINNASLSCGIKRGKTYYCIVENFTNDGFFDCSEVVGCIAKNNGKRNFSWYYNDNIINKVIRNVSIGAESSYWNGGSVDVKIYNSIAFNPSYSAGITNYRKSNHLNVYNSIAYAPDSSGNSVGTIIGNNNEQTGFTLSQLGFVDPDNGDFHLTTSSVAIDKGIEVPEFNILASNEPSPNGGKVNAGIYGGTSEAQITILAPDSNNIFYITPDGTSNCSSWNNACSIDKLDPDIKNYINNHPTENFKIFMKKGNYTLNKSIYLQYQGERIAIYGGLNGNETTPNTTNLSEKSIINFVNNTDTYAFVLGNDTNGATVYNLHLKCQTDPTAGFKKGKIYYSIAENFSENFMDCFIVKGCIAKNGTNYDYLWMYIGADAVAVQSVSNGAPEGFKNASNNGYTVNIYNCVSYNNSYSSRITNYRKSPQPINVYNSIAYDPGTNGNMIGTVIGDDNSEQTGYTLSQLGFVNPDNGDFHLKTSSVAIDKGVEVPEYNILVANEPSPNGGKVNAGLYGGTSEAQITVKSFQLSNLTCADNITIGENFNCSVDLNSFGGVSNGDIINFTWKVTKNGQSETLKTSSFTYNGESSVTISGENLNLSSNNYVNDANIVVEAAFESNSSDIKTAETNITPNVAPIKNLQITCSPTTIPYIEGQTNQISCSASHDTYNYGGTITYNWHWQEEPNNTDNILTLSTNTFTVDFTSDNQTKHIYVEAYVKTEENALSDFTTSNTVTVKTLAFPIINSFSCIPDNITVGDNTSCNIIATNPNDDGNALSYYWYINGNVNNFYTTNSINLTLNEANQYNIQVKVCDGNSCKISDNFTITVNPLQPPVINNFDCSPDNTTLGNIVNCNISASNPNNKGTLSYEWYIDSNLNSSLNGDNITLTPSTAKEYNIQVKACINDTACIFTENKTITIHPVLPPSINNFSCDKDNITVGDNISCTIIAFNPNDLGEIEYHWYIDNNLDTNFSNNLLNFVTEQAKNYIIKAEACVNGVCSFSNDINITVNPLAPPIINSFNCTPTQLDVGGDINCSISASNPNNKGTISYHWYIDGFVDNNYSNDNISLTTTSVKDYIFQVKACIENSCIYSDNITVNVQPVYPVIDNLTCSPEIIAYPTEDSTNCSINAQYDYGDLTYEWYINDTLDNTTPNNNSQTIHFSNEEIKNIKVKIYPTGYPEKFVISNSVQVITENISSIPVGIQFDDNVNINGGLSPYHLGFSVHLEKEIYKNYLNKIEVLLAKDNETYEVVHTFTDFNNLHFETNLAETGNYKLKLISYSTAQTDNNTYETGELNLKIINAPSNIQGELKVYKYTPDKIKISFKGGYYKIKKLVKSYFVKEFNEKIIPSTEKFTVSYNGITQEIMPTKWYKPYIYIHNDNITGQNIHAEFTLETTLGRKITASTDIDMSYENIINLTPDFVKKEYITTFYGKCYGYRSKCLKEFKSKKFISEKMNKLEWKVYKIDNGTSQLIDNKTGYYIKITDNSDGTYKIIMSGETSLGRTIHGEITKDIQWKKNAPVKASIGLYPVYIKSNGKIHIVKSNYVYPLTPYNVYLKAYFPNEKYLAGNIFEYSKDNITYETIGGNFDEKVKGVIFEINHIGMNYFRIKTKNKLSGAIYVSEPKIFETIPIPEEIFDANLPVKIKAKNYSKFYRIKFYIKYSDLKEFRENYLDISHNEKIKTRSQYWKITDLNNGQTVKDGSRAYIDIPIKNLNNLTANYKIEVELPTTLKRKIYANIILTKEDILNLIYSKQFNASKIENKKELAQESINLDNSTITYIQNPISINKVRIIFNIDGKIMSVLKEKGYSVEVNCGDGTIMHNLLNFVHKYPSIDNYSVTGKIINLSNGEIVKTITQNIELKTKSAYVQGLLDDNVIRLQKKYFDKIYKKLGLSIITNSEILYYLFPKIKRVVYVNNKKVSNIKRIYLPIDYSSNTVNVRLKIYSKIGKSVLAEKEYTIPIENDFYTETNIKKLIKLHQLIKVSDTKTNDYSKKYYWGCFKGKWSYDFESVLGYQPSRWYKYVDFLKRKTGLKVEWRLYNSNDEMVYKSKKRNNFIRIKEEGTYTPKLHITMKINGEAKNITITGDPVTLVNNPGNILVLNLKLYKFRKDHEQKFIYFVSSIKYDDPDTLPAKITYYINGHKIKYHYFKMKKTFLVPSELRGNIPDSCNIKIEITDKLGQKFTKELVIPVNQI